MTQDISELFARSKIDDFRYRELNLTTRGKEAIARWPLLEQTARQLERGKPASGPRPGAAGLFDRGQR